MVWGFFGLEDPLLIWPICNTKGQQAVLGLELGLVDEPVVVIRFSGLLVQEHDGLSHGAWYVPSGYARMRRVCPQDAGPTEVSA